MKRSMGSITCMNGINRYFIILLLLFISKFIYAQSKPRIFINELLASNLTTNPDMVDFGDYSDWIEIYNDENTEVNIGGYYLSDDFSNPTKWQIPANTIIPAKGFFFVWADDYNNVPGNTYVREWWPHSFSYTTKWCHTNFKLNKGGDRIGLFDVGGNAIDSVVFSEQLTDVSFGRQPDGSGNWFYFGEPTPQTANTTIGLNSTNYSGEVVFSIEGGYYSGSIQLSLSSSLGDGIIRFTTDGSIPKSSSQQYSSSITINKNTIVRARLFESSKLPGKTITNSYFINETQNLMAVSLVTEPVLLWDKQLGIYLNSLKERQIPVSLEFFPLNSNREYFLDAGARIGGQNIYRFAQKPFNIYAQSDYGFGKINYKIFDDLPFTEYDQLYLRNSGSDWSYTMFRDGLMVTILKDYISNPIQNYKPAVLYLNGQYWGINNLREKIDDTYFLLHYKTDEADLDHLNDDYTVVTGDSTDFVNLMTIVNGMDLSVQSNYEYVQSEIDINSLIDFIVVQDYIANSSWGHNREVWRDRKNSKLWKWILVDMDRGFEASDISRNQLSDLYNNFGLFRKLIANDGFKNLFVQRYAQLMNHAFNADRVVAKIDSIKSLIEDEMPRHIQKWGTKIDTSLSIDGGFGKHSSVTSMNFWNSEVQKLRDFAAQRTQYAVQYLNSILGLSGRANLKITSNVQNQGKITINNFFESFGTENLYFKDIPLSIQAYPPPGYSFKQWKAAGSSTKINLIPEGSSWKYRDENSAPDAAWKNIDYNDNGWKSGNAQFGYGDGDEKTVISFGTDSQNKYITSYYRNSFQLSDPAYVKELKLKLLRDDGAVVYLNGNEIVRSNMPSGTISNSTTATTAVGDTEESTFLEITVDKSKLTAGKNVIAVEIHQSSSTSSDVSFDLSLDAELYQQSIVENVIGTESVINFTITGDTELIAEFEQKGSGSLAHIINAPLTLTKANSPYYITSDVTIEQNGILMVEPGTVIYFSSGKSMYVKGKVIMNGNEAEPIILTSYYPFEKWGAICFDHSIGVSELNHVNISLATNGNDETNFFAALSSSHSAVNLNHVKFDDVKVPISSQWSDMNINSCTFENVNELEDYLNCNGGNLTVINSVFNGNNLSNMDGIDLGFMTGTSRIEGCTFRNFTGGNSDGIDIGDASQNVIIENNLFENMNDKGVSVGQGSYGIIRRNIFSNCNLGIGIKDNQSHAEIINCTFYSNNVGVACYEKNLNEGGGSAEVSNSIFANSKDASFTIDDLSTINFSYSLGDKDILPGNGNLLDDPLMINPDGGNFHIQTGSPCIDNGDPQSLPDNDGTRTDIGAFAYAGDSSPIIVINEINYNSAADFDSDDWIELYNRTNETIDLSGWVFMDENRTPSYVFNSGTNLESKSYVVICRNTVSFKSKYSGVVNYFGDMNFGFSGNGETVFLYDNLGRLVDSLTYNDKSPWPVEADGGGSSLELTNPAFDNAVGSNWKASIGHGTPGSINSTYIVGVEQDNEQLIPAEFSLHQNYPNPFNPATIIKYELPKQCKVSLIVYDLLGREIVKLVNDEKPAGSYEIKFDGRSLSSGVYFYTLKADSFTSTKKLLLIK